MHVTRDGLYEEVWAEPMLRVAERYGVSSSFLARICERLKVPRPTRGYWARVAFGQTPARPLLPPPQPGDELEWWRGRRVERASRPLPRPPTKDSASRRGRTRPTGPHPLVAEARELFETSPETKSGYLRPNKRNIVDIFVSRPAVSGALDTMNELLLALEGKGHHAVLAPRDQPLLRSSEVDEREHPSSGCRHYDWKSWRPGRATVAYLGTIPIGLTLFELSEDAEVEQEDGKYDGRFIRTARTDPPPRRSRYAPAPYVMKRDMPTGRLCLRAQCLDSRAKWERRWSESRPGQLLGRARTIVTELEREAPALGAMIEEGEREAERRRQAWEIERRKLEQQMGEERLARATKASREELSQIIDAWASARRIEEFFEDADRRTAGLDGEGRMVMAQRLRLGRELLGGVDALERFRRWRAPSERLRDW